MTKRANMIIISILLGAAGLRLWGAFSDLPNIFHPDESRYVSMIQRIFKTGDLNPYFFNYPSMFLYINAIFYIPYYNVGKLIGLFNSPEDIQEPINLIMGTSLSHSPGSIILGRSVTILFAVLAIFLIYMIGRRLTHQPWVGIIAAFLMTFSPVNVINSRFITPDIFVVFWGLMTLLASVLIFQEGKTWHYILAGFSIGFTASSKYNGALIALCVILAHFLKFGWPGIRDRRLYCAAALSAIGFILITPFSILDHVQFLDDLKFEAQHYATGHAGIEGNAFSWYLSYLWGKEGILSLLAVIQIIRGFYLRSKETILLSVFPVIYFVFISSFEVRNAHTLLPATPFLFLLTAILLVDLFNFGSFVSRQYHSLIKVVAVILFSLVVFIPISNTVKTTVRSTTIDSRTTGRLWINSNLPQGSKIAIEAYAPFIDPGKFSIQGVGRMIDNSTDWYIDNNYDYLVFSQGMYGRFYLEPGKYRAEVSEYDCFFNQFKLIKLFTDGNFEVKVYKVK